MKRHPKKKQMLNFYCVMLELKYAWWKFKNRNVKDGKWL